MEKLLLGLLFVALGAIIVYIAASSLVRMRRFVAAASYAYGEVVALEERGGPRAGTRTGTYAPVIRFVPTGGRPVEFTDEVSSNPPGYRVGEQVIVLYRAADPTDARLSAPFRLYGHDLIFTAGGLIFLLIGAVLIAAHLFN
jgi:hypothetical protein